ncbi:MAG: tRNA uracil 4-sulfurtransferase ThiI [Candidatus Hydrothermarchaeales archaeon]
MIHLLTMIIVRYGEIGTKSRQSRNRIEARLVKNIKKAIGKNKVKRTFGRIYVDSDSKKDAEKISRIFGVVSTSIAMKVASNFDTIIDEGAKYALSKIKENQTFAVRARRAGEHEFHSKDIEAELGAKIGGITKARVDLEAPDKTIYVEVREDHAYIFDEIIKGVGGLPLGTQGEAVALVSGGIDSPVAAWMMMARGATPICLYMDTRPLVDERTVDRAIQTIEKLAEWKNDDIKSYITPFGEVLMKLLKVEDYRLGCILCKRMMYRVGELVAEAEGAKALVTGENMGQVASQTLDNLYVIDEVIQRVPIFRPLIGMDKNGIIDLARRIGTYDISIRPANCCLGPPPNPVIRATLERVKKAESGLDAESLAKEIFENSRVEELG